jgi:hypothetical protein
MLSKSQKAATRTKPHICSYDLTLFVYYRIAYVFIHSPSRTISTHRSDPAKAKPLLELKEKLYVTQLDATADFKSSNAAGTYIP